MMPAWVTALKMTHKSSLSAWHQASSARHPPGPKKIIKTEVADTLGIADENFYDGIHPSIYGYERIAQAWFTALTTN